MEKKDWRLFKLNRLCELIDTLEIFEPREIPEERKDFDNYFTDDIPVSVLFDESVKYRLIEEYGVECYTVTENGKLLLQTNFTNREYMISWLLGFGDKAEVLFPKGLKQEIRKIAENMMKHYK